MSAPERTILRSGTETEMVEAAAALIIAEAYRAVADHGRFSLVLAGGNSPRPLYRHLALGVAPELLKPYGPLPAKGIALAGNGERLGMPWNHCWLFLGDERCVPFDHPWSNYRMIQENLIEPAGIAEERLFSMPAEEPDAAEGARMYERRIRTFFHAAEGPSSPLFPAFDLVLLGLGADGHTASLFGENPEALRETERWVVAVEAARASPPGRRLTLTLPVINHARNVLFFVAGRQKAEMAEKIQRGERSALPAAMIAPDTGVLYWFVSQA